jgi:hypothetical protein
VKRTTNDAKFSTYIRKRANWTCERCGRQFGGPSRGLHCAHFFGRQNIAVRHDPDNALSLCYGCHKYFDERDREDFRDFMKKKLGPNRFKMLLMHRHAYCKYDKKAVSMYLDQLLSELDG